ncbi:alpha/beta hydrolase [Crossiella sp. CA-258035]|uniref:alpha/beta fold hydrolase n=1 Tax=Crossiella sp. CA-258035 TaxID=2981138 RepID=UPI0024BC85D9|nr:alpha/beta hydrolase [Crossiella sp. CA-258035]WHT16002.1 alpha/beta hydrolase [Crossiella sp. CA-258035]
MTLLTVCGLDTHVQRMLPKGDRPEAPLVVCVHGILTDSLASYYFTLGPALAAAGYEVLMYDLRGHGRSHRPATGYQLERFVGDLRHLLDRLQVRRPVHLIGNSFGGTVAFGLAAANPELVASLAFIESEPALEPWRPKMAANLARAKRELVREESLAWIATEYNPHTARLAKGAAKLLHSTTIAEDIPDSEVLDEARVAAIEAPVFGIYGDRSDLAVQAPWLEGLLPRCRTVVIPDQEHSVLIERTPLTKALLLEWLNEHALSAPAGPVPPTRPSR